MEDIQEVEYFENQYLNSNSDIDQKIKEWHEWYIEAQEIIEDYEEREGIGAGFDEDALNDDDYFAMIHLDNYRPLLLEEKNRIFAYIEYKLKQDIKIKSDELIPVVNRYIFSCVSHLLDKVNAKNDLDFLLKFSELRNKMEEQAQTVNVEVLNDELYPVLPVDEHQLKNIQDDVYFLYEQMQKMQRERELEKRTLPQTADNRALFYLRNEEKIELPKPVKKKDIDLEKTLAYGYRKFQNRKQKTINYATINNYILLEKIEFYLFNSLSNDAELNKLLPGLRKGDEWIISNRIVINTKKPYGSNDFISYFMPCEKNCDMNNCPAKTCCNTTCTGSKETCPPCCSLQPNYGYSSLQCYQITQYALPTWDDLSRLHKLIALYKSINRIDWQEAVEELAEDFNIDTQNSFIYREDGLPPNVSSANHLSETTMHSFFIKDSYLLPNTQPPKGYIKFRKSRESEKLLLIGTEEVLLPVSNYIRIGDRAHSTFNFLSRRKLPLSNLKFFIEEYKHYPVLLTSDLHFANDNALDLLKRNAIVTSWYGKEFTYKNIDFKPLEGRQLYYLYNEDSEEETKILIRLFDLFFEKRKITLKVLIRDPEGNTEALTMMEFLELVIEQGNKKLLTEQLKEYSSDEIDTYPAKKTETKFIISPIIAEKDLVILFAPSDYGKTWLAEAMAVAVSEGKEVFSQWQVKKPRKTLLIVGEMDKQSHSNRFYDINEIYDRKKKDGKKMLIAKRANINLVTDEGRFYVKNLLEDYKGIELIIFDNLLTLAPKATFEDEWDDLKQWFKSLGITIIMLHHTNRQGEFRGTGDIKIKSDFMIFGTEKEQIINFILQKVKKERGVKKLNFLDIEKIFDDKYPEQTGDNILTLYIDYEKKRNVKESDAQIFRTVFNFDEHSKSSTSIDIDNDIIPLIENHLELTVKKAEEKLIYPDSKFTKWNENLQKSKIKELKSDGHTTPSMADKLSVSETTINRIRKKTNTQDKDLANSD